MVKYSKEIQLTDNQRCCVIKLKAAFRNLRRCGLKIVANGTFLSIYKVKDFKNSDLRDRDDKSCILSNYPVPSGDIEQLDSISSFEDRYYKKGYITEE